MSDTVETFVKGDTVLKTIIRWRVKTNQDTVYASKTDTIRAKEPYPVEVVKEVKRGPNWWQLILMCLGAGLIGLLVQKMRARG